MLERLFLQRSVEVKAQGRHIRGVLTTKQLSLFEVLKGPLATQGSAAQSRYRDESKDDLFEIIQLLAQNR